ncbi:MAG: DNA repair and recombination protein RadB [Candidatus Nanosalina sp.]
MEVSRVSTGCKPLDSLLGGGVERGVISNFYGESGSGKTNVCIQIAAEVAENGEKVAYIDTEASFSAERFIQIASEEELDNILLKDATDFQEQKQAIESLEDVKDNLGLIIVDSMVSLYRLKVKGDNASEINNELSSQLSKLSGIARKQDIPVVVTNQVYTSFEEDDLEIVGRDVPRYWSKCLVQLSQNGEGVRKAEIAKHRSIAEGQEVSFKITDEGLEQDEESGLF